MTTDPIADMLTRIRNAAMAKHARGKANLAAFVDRVKTKYWAKLDEPQG